MEVSSQDAVESSGQELIQTLVTATGLPEEWIHNELDHILETSGQTSVDITLEQLRASMLAYLEAMQADFVDEDVLPVE
jgi:hypothetical protein